MALLSKFSNCWAARSATASGGTTTFWPPCVAETCRQQACSSSTSGRRHRPRCAPWSAAVMAQDHGVVVAEVMHQPLTLVEIERDAFVVVVAGAAENCIDIWFREQALFLRRHRHAGRGVAVHALRVARHMHRRMDVKPALLILASSRLSIAWPSASTAIRLDAVISSNRWRTG